MGYSALLKRHFKMCQCNSTASNAFTVTLHAIVSLSTVYVCTFEIYILAEEAISEEQLVDNFV